ncbi:MAG: LLM class F420-dependent oxidoreductase [Acidimicrobiia bacterium]
MRFRIFVEPQEGATYEDQLAIALLAEELGFDAFFRSDHYISFFGGEGLPGPTDAWTTIAGLARDTSRLRLGTLVSPITFRLPGPLAISVAQIDAMSSGRVELGIGAGWNDREHRAYGIPFPPTGERFDRLEEQLKIVVGLWTAPVGEHFSFSGRYYEVDDSPALPKPLQEPHPPIVIGGFGPKRTPRLAARYASEFNAAFQPPEMFPGSVARVRAACEASGRNPASLGVSIANTVVCGASDREIERRAAAIGRTREQAEQGLGGTPAQVVDRIGIYRDAGADTVYLQVLDLHDHDHLRLLAAEVVPAFASSPGGG